MDNKKLIYHSADNGFAEKLSKIAHCYINKNTRTGMLVIEKEKELIIGMVESMDDEQYLDMIYGFVSGLCKMGGKSSQVVNDGVANEDKFLNRLEISLSDYSMITNIDTLKGGDSGNEKKDCN